MKIKFKQMQTEIISKIDDLDLTAELFDELLCATNNHKILKKYFWNVKYLLRLFRNVYSHLYSFNFKVS